MLKHCCLSDRNSEKHQSSVCLCTEVLHSLHCC